jgi:hypothetical protein
MKNRLSRRAFLERASRVTGASMFLERGDARLHAAPFRAPDEAAAILSVKVVDAETRQVIPCTVTIRTSKGEILAGHASFAGGFRSLGQFEKEVPPGETTLVVSRGFDDIAVERKLNLAPGERQELTLELKRRAGLRGQGWVCGDSHDHMIHGEKQVTVDFAYVAMAGRAAGLDYMSLAQEWNLASPTPAKLQEVCDKVSTEEFKLTWNMEAPKNYWRGDVSHCLGHGWTLAMQGYTPDGRDAIAELRKLSAHDYETEKTPAPNFESHALIHSLGGIVSYTHPAREWRGRWGGEGGFPVEENKFVSNLAQELPFDTVVGPTYDTLDILMRTEEKEVNQKAQQLWFMLLNHGYRIAATASTDSCFDRPGGGDPGRVRVYTHVGNNSGLSEIAEAMRRGRNFVSSGPLLLFTIDQYQIGDVIPIRSPRKLLAHLSAWAGGELGERLSRLELIRNGEVLRTFDVPEGRTQASIDVELEEKDTAWYIARCWGSSEHQVAITNPIYFQGPSYKPPAPAQAQVTGIVKDRQTGAPLEGNCEVLERVGLTPVTKSRQPFGNGSFSISVPGTARIRVNVIGYISEERSIFVDHTPLLNFILGLHSEQLIDWRTFEEVKALLADVRFEFALSRQA